MRNVLSFLLGAVILAAWAYLGWLLMGKEPYESVGGAFGFIGTLLGMFAIGVAGFAAFAVGDMCLCKCEEYFQARKP